MNSSTDAVTNLTADTLTVTALYYYPPRELFNVFFDLSSETGV